MSKIHNTFDMNVKREIGEPKKNQPIWVLIKSNKSATKKAHRTQSKTIERSIVVIRSTTLDWALHFVCKRERKC